MNGCGFFNEFCHTQILYTIVCFLLFDPSICVYFYASSVFIGNTRLRVKFSYNERLCD